MFRMYASNYHSYTHLILALGIVREPTVWVFITSKYPDIHDIGLPSNNSARSKNLNWNPGSGKGSKMSSVAAFGASARSSA